MRRDRTSDLCVNPWRRVLAPPASSRKLQSSRRHAESAHGLPHTRRCRQVAWCPGCAAFTFSLGCSDCVRTVAGHRADGANGLDWRARDRRSPFEFVDPPIATRLLFATALPAALLTKNPSGARRSDSGRKDGSARTSWSAMRQAPDERPACSPARDGSSREHQARSRERIAARRIDRSPPPGQPLLVESIGEAARSGTHRALRADSAISCRLRCPPLSPNA